MILWVSIICGLIVVLVTVLSIVTTSKAYSYKHEVDPVPEDEGTDEKQDISK